LQSCVDQLDYAGSQADGSDWVRHGRG
jgi:hypothetical protein